MNPSFLLAVVGGLVGASVAYGLDTKMGTMLFEYGVFFGIVWALVMIANPRLYVGIMDLVSIKVRSAYYAYTFKPSGASKTVDSDETHFEFDQGIDYSSYEIPTYLRRGYDRRAL